MRQPWCSWMQQPVCLRANLLHNPTSKPSLLPPACAAVFEFEKFAAGTNSISHLLADLTVNKGARAWGGQQAMGCMGSRGRQKVAFPRLCCALL